MTTIIAVIRMLVMGLAPTEQARPRRPRRARLTATVIMHHTASLGIPCVNADLVREFRRAEPTAATFLGSRLAQDRHLRFDTNTIHDTTIDAVPQRW